MSDLRFTIYDLRLGLLLAIFLPFAASAHDSPEHVIAQLSARLAAGETNAELLWERATEYRALGRLASAARDLTEASKVQPDFLPALTDLARVELALGKTATALATIDRAFAQTPDESGRGPLYMMRADVHLARGDLEKALADCDRAFRLVPAPEADWYLTRSQLQARLGRFEEAAAGLQQAFEQTSNAVLEAEWIDALLDAGHCRQALERIEPRLAESRCQSSWLLRRARARLGLGKATTARGDLHAAISEINERLNPLQPEPTLLAERGLAYALLGDRESARQDLNSARHRGADAGMIQRLETAIAKTR
jgi:tetratricopeptide (TPR) repeat protein